MPIPDAEQREEVFLIEQVDPFAGLDEHNQHLENDVNDLIIVENVDPLGNVVENLGDGRIDPNGNEADATFEEPTNAIDPPRNAPEHDDALERDDNSGVHCGFIKIELLEIETENLDELLQLFQEADNSTAQSNNEPSTDQQQGAPEGEEQVSSAAASVSRSHSPLEDDEPDIVWVEIPDQIYPEPISCPDYGLTKREGDRFSGNIAYREMVIKY